MQGKRRVSPQLCLALLVAFSLTASVESAYAAPASQLIVVLKRDASSQKISALIEQSSGHVIGELRAAHALTVRPRGSIALEPLRKRLAKLPGVRYVEHDFIVKQTKIPDDPLFEAQYQHFQLDDRDIDSTATWDQRTSCSKVAILDTGVQVDHPDLEGKIWKNTKETAGNGKDDDGNGFIDDYYGVDLHTNRGSGNDNNGHGTHVAGIIGARGNNNVGVTGVCWSATLMPLKFLGADGQGYTSDAIKGIDYAIAKGAKVINCSFASDSKSSAFEEAVERAQESGVLLVVAAGNDGKNIDKTPVYPASFAETNIIAVGASDINDKLASYSNYGKTSVDLIAPGDGILSTYLGSSYAELSGTSMATPMVSGVAAMLHAQNSSATYSEIRKAIRDSVDKISAADGKTYSNGRLNGVGALDKLV